MSSSVWLNDTLSSKVKENEVFHENAKFVVEDILKGKLDITTLVERLSGVLTDTNPEIRARGMMLYSRVLTFLPMDYLTEEQLAFISAFYLDRLRDNHRVIPAVIDGLLALVKMKNVPKDVPSKIILSINQNVPCQQQVRTDRHIIFSIIQILIQNYSNELKAMGPDLVYGVISAMDGERDPRNLMLLFTLLPKFLEEVPLGHLAEEMFEIIACYYPVDFNSPPDDPNAITRNDLAEKLSLCLCATSTFSTFCLPLLLEKLDSALKIAKLDSLKLLKQSSNTFCATNYEPHLQNIWTALQRELTNRADSEIAFAAHDAFSALVSNLCSDSSQPTISDAFLKQIVTSMKILLAEAKTKLLLNVPLGVFLTAANASEKSCIFITENIVPLIIVHHHLNLNEELQVHSLDWFSRMYSVCKNWNVLHQMSSHFVQIPKMCIVAMGLSNENMKIASFKTIANLSEIIDESDLSILCNILNQHLNGHFSKSIIDSCKVCLLQLSSKRPNAFSDFVLDKLNLDHIINNVDLLEKQLDLLCSLASIPTFTELIMAKILDILDNKGKNVSQTMIKVIFQNFENKELFTKSQIHEIQKKYDVLKHILNWLDLHMSTIDSEFLQVVSSLIVNVTRILDSVEQRNLISAHVPSYLNKVSVNSIYIIPIESLLNSSRQDVKIVNIEDVLTRAAEVAFDEIDRFIHHKACLLIANILNKYGKDEEIMNQYNDIKENITNKMDKNMNDNICTNSIILCSWIAKSLLLSGHNEAQFWLLKLIQLLNDEKWGLQAAKGFKLIVKESSEALNANCYCNSSFLFHQKLFHTFTRQTEAINSLCPNREALLLAWVYIIQSLPKTVLEMESSKISSILIESLNFTEKDLLVASLSILSFLIQMKNSTVAGSLQTLLPRCIKLASLNNTMEVRKASLQCLFDVASSYQTVLLLPYKEDIVYQLSSSVGDPKRLVRSTAVKARTRWFLVGSPGEDKIKIS